MHAKREGYFVVHKEYCVQEKAIAIIREIQRLKQPKTEMILSGGNENAVRCS